MTGVMGSVEEARSFCVTNGTAFLILELPAGLAILAMATSISRVQWRNTSRILIQIALVTVIFSIHFDDVCRSIATDKSTYMFDQCLRCRTAEGNDFCNNLPHRARLDKKVPELLRRTLVYQERAWQ